MKVKKTHFLIKFCVVFRSTKLSKSYNKMEYNFANCEQKKINLHISLGTN